jgi:hypothetical protein
MFHLLILSHNESQIKSPLPTIYLCGVGHRMQSVGGMFRSSQPNRGLHHKKDISHLGQNTVSSFYLPSITLSRLSFLSDVYKDTPFAHSGPCDPLSGTCWSVSSHGLRCCVPNGAAKLSIWSGKIFYSRQPILISIIYWPCLFTISQRASGSEVCSSTDWSFATCTMLTRLVQTGLLGLLSALIVPLHDYGNDL